MRLKMLGKISFSVSIDTDAHAAFGDTPEEAKDEILRAVREMLDRVENTSDGNTDWNYMFCIKDINGNTIGKSYLDIEYEDPEEIKEEDLEEVGILIEKSAKYILEKDGDCSDVDDCAYCPMYTEDCTSIDRVKFLKENGYHL